MTSAETGPPPRRRSASAERDLSPSHHRTRRKHSTQHAQRSISQTFLRAVIGASVDSDSEDEATYFLVRPTSNTEAVAAFNPTLSSRRVSAIIRPSRSRRSFHSARDISIVQHDSPEAGNDSALVDGEDDVSTATEYAEIPYGVRKMEVIAKHIKRPFLPIYLITLFTSLSSTTTPAVEPFLLSSFGGHAYISSIAIITSIAYAVCKPPMAKILDVFGRSEGLAVSAVLYGIGFLLVACSNGIVSFGAARVIGSAGAQGINLAQQVVVADITSLASRALALSTIFLPWLVTPWIGPPIGQWFKDQGETGFRAAYACFGILVPLSCVFLLIVLRSGYHRVLALSSSGAPLLDAFKDDGFEVDADATLVWQPRNTSDLAAEALAELDVAGILYLMVGCTLLLLPLSLAASSPRSWHDPAYPVLALLGLLVLVVLGYHETYTAKHPLIPTRLLKQKTVMSGCALCSFHFFCQFAYESYFPSFLQVARGYSARDASYISESYVFTASIAALICGGLVRITKRYRTWMIIGILIHIVGAIMMVRFRSLDNTTMQIVISQVISGLGGGFTTLGAQLGVQAVVEHQDVAVVTAVFLTITQIGGAVGGAVSGIIWTTFLPAKLRTYMPDMAEADIKRIFGSMAVALSYEPGSPERIAINQSYFECQRLLNIAALTGLLPALISALLMADVKLAHKEETTRVVMMSGIVGTLYTLTQTR